MRNSHETQSSKNAKSDVWSLGGMKTACSNSTCECKTNSAKNVTTEEKCSVASCSPTILREGVNASGTVLLEQEGSDEAAYLLEVNVPPLLLHCSEMEPGIARRCIVRGRGTSRGGRPSQSLGGPLAGSATICCTAQSHSCLLRSYFQ